MNYLDGKLREGVGITGHISAPSDDVNHCSKAPTYNGYVRYHEYAYATKELVDEGNGRGHFYYLFICKWCLHFERKFAE